MLYAGIDEDKSVALRVPGEILEFAAAAVKAHEVAGLTVAGGELVHDAAVYADVFMLGSLSDFGQGHAVNVAFTEEIVHSEGKTAFKCCGAGHTGTEGNIAGKGTIEALDRYAECHHFAADAEDVAEVHGAGPLLIVEGKLCVVLQVNRVGAHDTCTVGLDFSYHTLLDCAGENETAIIVGVLTDEVDTAGRGINITGSAVEVFDETAAYIVDSEFHGDRFYFIVGFINGGGGATITSALRSAVFIVNVTDASLPFIQLFN